MSNVDKCPYPSVIERYFRRGFKLDMKGPEEDFCILKHSNRVCLLTLAPSHPIVKNTKTVKNVDFQVSSKMNRLDNKVSGKSKKGGQWLNPTSALCCVTCDDDSNYTMYSCIRGKLAEVNEKLLKTPNLLKEKYDKDGYIAIILPKIYETDEQMKSLLTEEQYNEAIVSRGLRTAEDMPVEQKGGTEKQLNEALGNRTLSVENTTVEQSGDTDHVNT
ncbi:protein Abitram-like [Antedon mediterranea]|uniref:protein Abitram-like n=1 Tax=Antedon mediterranea TaxID=105859 RepID=UPI003AF6E55B